jgi:hypothetical protein
MESGMRSVAERVLFLAWLAVCAIAMTAVAAVTACAIITVRVIDALPRRRGA